MKCCFIFFLLWQWPSMILSNKNEHFLVDRFQNIDECRSSALACPCIPKCCPFGTILSKHHENSGINDLHCQKHNGTELIPQINLSGSVSWPLKNMKFFYSAFPSCLDGFDILDAESITLNAEHEDEYVLHKINDTFKVISNFGNMAKRRTKWRQGKSLMIKPLMHFCFDVMWVRKDVARSVALTCRRRSASSLKGVILNKCCPPGQILADASLSKCVPQSSNAKYWWRIPINGHLFSQKELVEGGTLIFSQNKSYLTTQGIATCAKSIQEEIDSFHIGFDGNIHFTDTHHEVDRLSSFCIEQLFEENEEEEEEEEEEKKRHNILSEPKMKGTNETFDHYNDKEEYTEYDNSGHIHFSSNYDYNTKEFHRTESSSAMKIASLRCHNPDIKPHAMVAFMCMESIFQMRKCCKNGENLNLRGGSCTNDLATKWNLNSSHLPIVFESINNTFKDVTIRQMNIIDMNIYNFELATLVASNRPFNLLRNGSLLYRGKLYREKQFCLEFTLDYCSPNNNNYDDSADVAISSELLAIISDASLISDSASTLFGSGHRDSDISKILKQVGYPVSITFLCATLLVFALLGTHVTKDLHGKMAISVVASLICLYVLLFMDTFPSRTTSKTNYMCIFRGAMTYFFILQSFAWMTAISFNIMCKFRSVAFNSRSKEKQRFKIYACFCLGIPAIFLCIVLIIDRLDRSLIRSSLRPGFGEESCWFTYCSLALSIYLYGPIGMTMILNSGMFIYTSIRLHSMQRRATLASKTLHAASVIYENRSSSNSKKHQQQQKESLITYVKLFIVMGLNWSIEILAWFCSTMSEPAPEWLQIILNVVNIFQGITIFLVFTLKPSIYLKLRNSVNIYNSIKRRFRIVVKPQMDSRKPDDAIERQTATIFGRGPSEKSRTRRTTLSILSLTTDTAFPKNPPSTDIELMDAVKELPLPKL